MPLARRSRPTMMAITMKTVPMATTAGMLDWAALTVETLTESKYAEASCAKVDAAEGRTVPIRAMRRRFTGLSPGKRHEKGPSERHAQRQEDYARIDFGRNVVLGNCPSESVDLRRVHLEDFTNVVEHRRNDGKAEPDSEPGRECGLIESHLGAFAGMCRVMLRLRKGASGQSGIASCSTSPLLIGTA